MQPDERDLDGWTPMGAVWRTVVEGVTGSMAYLADKHWNVVACNDEFRALIPDGRPPSNIMRWMLLDDRARHDVLMNWTEDWARGACPALRRAVTNHPADPALIDLASDVRSDPLAGPIYLATASSHPLHPDGVVRQVNHPTKGPGWVTATAASPLPTIDAMFVMMRYRPGEVRPHQPPPLSTNAL
ncbi:MmyB family transcriptional regulator [Streptomyces venezuelae]|uniref:MmyB family transcriptional regulator n=1 Tax=Streptomyces venezuelae TaxID=54571 RepID=UPI00123AF239